MSKMSEMMIVNKKPKEKVVVVVVLGKHIDRQISLRDSMCLENNLAIAKVPMVILLYKPAQVQLQGADSY